MRRFMLTTLTAVLASSLGAGPAFAQDLQYTTAGKVEFSGAIGSMMKLFGGAAETLETTYIKGSMMRTDSEGSSVITDLATGRIITIDHEAKTFTILTLEQMVEAMSSAMDEAKAEAAAERRDAAAADEPQTDVDVTYDFSIEKANERREINGYDAERYFMTVETEITATPEGGETEEAGRMVIFTELWNADDVPAAQVLEELYRKAPEMAARNQEAFQGMASALGNPEIREAMEEAAKESAEMSGFTMRSTTWVVMVPPDQQFDRQLALEPAKKESGGIAKKALGGLLGGALGGGKKEEPEEEAPTQATFMTIISETRDMKTVSLPADLFEPPAGYTEKPFSLTGG